MEQLKIGQVVVHIKTGTIGVVHSILPDRFHDLPNGCVLVDSGGRVGQPNRYEPKHLRVLNADQIEWLSEDVKTRLIFSLLSLAMQHGN